MKDLLITLLPLMAIMLLGFMSKLLKIIKKEDIHGFKNIIVKLILPGVLFSSFSHTDLSITTWLLALFMFLLCMILYFYGYIIKKLLPRLFTYEKSGYFMTGFEFGMMGVGLLAAIWNESILPLVMPLALGHELFIWFFYAPNLNRSDLHKTDYWQIIKDFIKTPTVIGISLGIVINALGFTPIFETSSIGQIIYKTISILTPAVGPMILLYIGFNLDFGSLNFKETFVYSVFRWIGVGISIILGYAIFPLISKDLVPLFYSGFLGFLMLPPPFIIPLFVKKHESKAFYTQLLLVNTLLSFVGYAIILYLL